MARFTNRETRSDVGNGHDDKPSRSEEGIASVCVAIDHCTCECVGIHAAKMANRHFEALEPIRQGVCEHFGAFEKNIAMNRTDIRRVHPVAHCHI